MMKALMCVVMMLMIPVVFAGGGTIAQTGIAQSGGHLTVRLSNDLGQVMHAVPVEMVAEDGTHVVQLPDSSGLVEGVPSNLGIANEFVVHEVPTRNGETIGQLVRMTPNSDLSDSNPDVVEVRFFSPEARCVVLSSSEPARDPVSAGNWTLIACGSSPAKFSIPACVGLLPTKESIDRYFAFKDLPMTAGFEQALLIRVSEGSRIPGDVVLKLNIKDRDYGGTPVAYSYYVGSGSTNGNSALEVTVVDASDSHAQVLVSGALLPGDNLVLLSPSAELIGGYAQEPGQPAFTGASGDGGAGGSGIAPGIEADDADEVCGTCTPQPPTSLCAADASDDPCTPEEPANECPDECAVYTFSPATKEYFADELGGDQAKMCAGVGGSASRRVCVKYSGGTGTSFTVGIAGQSMTFEVGMELSGQVCVSGEVSGSDIDPNGACPTTACGVCGIQFQCRERINQKWWTCEDVSCWWEPNKECVEIELVTFCDKLTGSYLETCNRCPKEQQ